MTSIPNNIPHEPYCVVYRAAAGLLGVDRRGMCDCGAEQGNPIKRPGYQDQAGSARRSRDSYDLPGRIVIDVNPHESQRYDTVGDYQVVEGGFVNAREKVLWITVSRLADRRESLLIAIHELIEAALCATAGVDFAKIDDFDFHQGWPDEPGDHIQAPYYRQHQIASGIERLLAAEMKVDWLEYETHCKELSHDRETK